MIEDTKIFSINHHIIKNTQHKYKTQSPIVQQNAARYKLQNQYKKSDVIQLSCLSSSNQIVEARTFC